MFTYTINSLSITHLCADTQVVVGHKFRALMVGVLLVGQVGIQHAETDGRHGDEERHLLPQLMATCNMNKNNYIIRQALISHHVL